MEEDEEMGEEEREGAEGKGRKWMGREGRERGGLVPKI